MQHPRAAHGGAGLNLDGAPDDLERAADELLREHGSREVCPECGSDGAPTGETADVAQDHHDDAGRQLVITFERRACAAGHSWWAGSGRRGGITTGDHPVLLDEHLRDRTSREVYTAAGTPDPGITRGMFWRTHPEGRRASTPEQRQQSGAGFYA